MSIQTVPAFAVDVVHKPCDFFLSQFVKGAALGQHDTDILVAAFNAAFLPCGVRVAVKNLCALFSSGRCFKCAAAGKLGSIPNSV